MKSLFVLLAVSLLFINVYGQKMTPREFAALNGNVKSFVVERAILSVDDEKFDPDERLFDSEEYFDKSGNIEVKNTAITGFKSTIRYVYDTQGRIIEERKFDLKGVQYFTTIVKYNAKGQILEQAYYARKNVTANIYSTFDSDGNEQERKFVPTKFNMLKLAFVFRYSDYEFDDQKNWIRRSVVETSKLNGKSTVTKLIQHRTIEYYK